MYPSTEARIVSTRHGSERVTVTISGRLNLASTKQLRHTLRGLLDADVLYLLVDLTDLDLTVSNPVLIGILTRAQAQLRKRGGVLLTTGAPAGVVEELDTAASLLEAFGLYQIEVRRRAEREAQISAQDDAESTLSA